MLDGLFGGPGRKLERKFEKAARQAPAGPLADYYKAGLPDLEGPASSAALMAIDLETDGLDAAHDMILEAGMIGMSGETIHSASALRVQFRAAAALNPQAVAIHHITDDAAAGAMLPADALAHVLEACASKALVAHFAEIEAGFLDAACRRHFGGPFVAPFICTMQLETRWFPRSRAQDGLRLGKLRSAYGLPTYRAHDGLTDALACGELLLAQLARASRADTPLSGLLRH